MITDLLDPATAIASVSSVFVVSAAVGLFVALVDVLTARISE